MARTLYVSDEEEYSTAETPLLGSFPPHLEDELVSASDGSSCYVLGLVLTIVFASDLAGSISKAPLIRVYESIICNEHYKIADPSGVQQSGQVDERYCKVAPVQEELALLRGWQDFFDYLPGMFSNKDKNPFPLISDHQQIKHSTLEDASLPVSPLTRLCTQTRPWDTSKTQ